MPLDKETSDPKEVATPNPIFKVAAKVDAIIDKWWADNVAVLQRSVAAWGPAVDAKEELKRRITEAGADLFK